MGSEKWNRDSTAMVGNIKVVESEEGEDPGWWLVSNDGDEFPIYIDQLHDVLHALHELHDKQHQH